MTRALQLWGIVGLMGLLTVITLPMLFVGSCLVTVSETIAEQWVFPLAVRADRLTEEGGE